nr:MAG TPA: N-terminal conserved domain of Nudc [Caudoviricetes sp.]
MFDFFLSCCAIFLHRNTDFYRGRAGNDAVDLIFRDLAMCCFFSHVESLIASLLILVGIGTASKAVICWSFTKGILIYLATY